MSSDPYFGSPDEIVQLRAEVERLKAEIEREKAQFKIVLDSYADENQRFHDMNERLRSAIKDQGAWYADLLKRKDELCDYNARLRSALEWYAQGGTNWDKGKRARTALADQEKALEQFYDANPSDAPFGSD